MRFFGSGSAVALIASAQVAHASETTSVVVTGMGIDGDAATRNAWSAAISQVVGTMVSADVVISNNKLLKNEVLSHSRGFVEHYEEIDRRVNNGIFEVEARVTVRKSQLHERLVDLEIVRVQIDGGSLAAQIQTKIQESSDAAAMLKGSIEPFHRGVTTVALSGKPDVKVVGERATVTYYAQLSINSARWDTAVAGLIEVLDEVAVERHTVQGTYNDITYCDELDLGKMLPGRNFLSDRTCVLVLQPSIKRYAHQRLYDAQMTAIRYAVPTAPLIEAEPWTGNHRVNLTLRDADGGIVAANRMKCSSTGDVSDPCYGDNLESSTGIVGWMGGAGAYLVFAGEVGIDSRGTTRFGVAKLESTFDLTMEDASRVTEAELTLEYQQRGSREWPP